MDAGWMREDLAAIYPQFGLRVAHAGLVLGPPTDLELLELAEVVGEPGGIVEPGHEEFVTWPVGTGADAADAFLRFHWGLRVRPGPGRWLVPFAVLLDGHAVGVAGLGADGWRPDTRATDRVVETRSWLARRSQGAGLGRRVRLMLLELAFTGLGATRATSTAAASNVASQRVSLRCGYRESGRGTGADGVAEVHYSVTPAAWRRRRLTDVDVSGVEPFLAALGRTP